MRTQFSLRCYSDSDGVYLSFLENGIERQRQVLGWEEIEEVWAYKRDLFTVDQICLAIKGEDVELFVTEDISGWAELIAALPTGLPGCLPPEEWLSGVTHPAFEENLTLLYKQ